MKMPHLIALFGCLLGSPAVISPPASGQDALGAGDALDANLNRRTGRRNQTSQRLDFRSRNLLVTGDIAGARGFRGTVGYSAADDFRGLTGSDDLFQFHSNSALTSLSIIQSGSVFQDFRLGQNIGQLSYRRPGRSGAAPNHVTSRLMYGDMADARSQLDQVTFERLVAGRRSRLGEPSRLGLALNDEGQAFMMSASSLQGLGLTPLEGGDRAPLTSYDRMRRREEDRRGSAADRLGLLSSNRFNDARIISILPDQSINAENRAGDEPYLDILRRIAERYESATNVDVEVESDLLTGLSEQYQSLRNRLVAKGIGSKSVIPDQPVERFDPSDSSDDIQPDVAVERPVPQKGPEIELTTIERFGVILKHGEQLQHYFSARDDRFSELMRTAEERLGKGEYFWAERRFNRALRFMPSHPLAQAGVAHAQIGAGLYLPCAFTLRRLLTGQPEMIDVRYASELLPAPNRLAKAVIELQLRIDQQIEVAPHGFVLAYLGHHLDDPTLIREGLEHMRTAPDDEAFITLLQSVWGED